MGRPRLGHEGYRRKAFIEAGKQEYLASGTQHGITATDIVNAASAMIAEEPPYDSYSSKPVRSAFNFAFDTLSDFQRLAYEELFKDYGIGFEPKAQANSLDSLWFELHSQVYTEDWKPELLADIRSKENVSISIFIRGLLYSSDRRIKDGHTVDDLINLLKSLEYGMKLRSLGNMAISPNLEQDDISGSTNNQRVLEAGIKAIFDSFTEPNEAFEE